MKTTLVSALLISLMSLPAWAANISVTDAWVRATMPGQPVGAAHMPRESDADARLVVASGSAGARVGAPVL